ENQRDPKDRVSLIEHVCYHYNPIAVNEAVEGTVGVGWAPAMQVVVYQSRFGIVKRLINAGADVNAVPKRWCGDDGITRLTLLDSIVLAPIDRAEQRDIVQCMVENGAEVNKDQVWRIVKSWGRWDLGEALGLREEAVEKLRSLEGMDEA